MPFGMVSVVGRGMGVLDGVVIIEGKGSFGSEFGASHCYQWGLCCIVVREQCAVLTYYSEDLFFYCYMSKGRGSACPSELTESYLTYDYPVRRLLGTL